MYFHRTITLCKYFLGIDDKCLYKSIKFLFFTYPRSKEEGTTDTTTVLYCSSN